MTVYASRPAVVFPPHEITLEQIKQDISDHHPDLPRLRAVLRNVEATQVATRYFTRPLDEAVRTAPLVERNTRAFADLCELGELAARQALDANGLSPGDVDCIVTSHSTGLAIPGLDNILIRRLGLRPSVRRIPMTQLGCAGGAYVMSRAFEQVKAWPGSRVLAVCAETLSSVYQRSDTTVHSMIYRALFGDSAAATIVTDTPRPGGGFEFIDSWEYTLPDSAQRYRLRVEDDGFHFDSTREALDSTTELMAPLLDWYGKVSPGAPQFVVAHPGGPRILQDLADGLEGGDHLLAHSWASLRRRGNLGGVAVLDVLDRWHADPPADGAEGFLIGLGPGFSAAACAGRWTAP